MIKLIAIDIGGTLIDDNNNISNEIINKIIYAKSKGIKIAICTARMYSSTKKIINQLECNYAVFSNGSYIYDISKDKVIYESIIKKDKIKYLIEYGTKNNLYILLNERKYEISNIKDYFYKKHYILNKEYEKNDKSNIKFRSDIGNYSQKQDILKVLFVSEKNMDYVFKHLKNKNYYITEYNKNLYENVIKKTINYIEIGTEKSDKSIGVERLCNYLSLNMDEVLVIGDGINDIEMFLKYKNNACMKNGCDQLKSISSYITIRDNNHSGVVDAIERYVK